MKKVVFFLLAVAVVVTTACKKEETVSVTGVKLDRETLGLVLDDPVYGQATLKETVEPESAENKKVTWAVSEGNAVSVDNGVVKALRLGKATVTVTTEDGGFKASCEVEVTEKIVDVESVTIEVEGGGDFEIEEGATLTLKAIVTPSSATRPSITWGSANDAIAKVNVTTGVVTGVARSETPVKISVSVSTPGGGQASADCDVTVVPPGVLNQVAEADIWYVHAKMTWKTGFEVDSIAVKGVGEGNTFERGVKLNTDAVENRNYVITGLTPDRYYMATIYNGDDEFNTVRFKTPEIPLDGIIDIPAGYDFASFFNNNAKNGWVLQLAGNGAEYSVDRLRIRTSVTIKGGEGGTKFINTNNYKMFGNGDESNTMEILFEGIHFYGGNADLFNVDADKSPDPSINVKSFTIKNCIVENFSTSFLRTGDAKDKIDELIFENSIFKAASGTGRGIFDCTAGATLGKFTIKNCTFENLNGIIRWTNYTTGEPIINVESCTFYNAGNNDAANAYLFNLNHSAAKATVTKCLFTKGKQDEMQTVRIASDGTVTSTENYRSNDYGQGENYAIEMTLYDGDAAALFINPATGDFHIKATSFEGKGKSGDPRWY